MKKGIWWGITERGTKMRRTIHQHAFIENRDKEQDAHS